MYQLHEEAEDGFTKINEDFMPNLRYLVTGLLAASACFSSYAATTAGQEGVLKEVENLSHLAIAGPKVDIAYAPNEFVAAVQDYNASKANEGKAEVEHNVVDAVELISNGEVNIQELPSAAPSKQQRASSFSAMPDDAEPMAEPASPLAITPKCSTLSTGTLYTVNGATTGSAYCFHFHVPSRSKAKVFVTNIPQGSNMSLTLFKHEADDSLSVVGQSNNAGNSPELITTLTEAGDYYWYIQAVEADNTSFNFATALNTHADAYEVNETLAQATVLPDKVNNINANIDEAGDYDYYSFKVVRGQRILFYLTKQSEAAPSNQWLFDYYTGSGWQRLKNANGYSLAPAAGSTIYLRVSHNPEQAIHPEYNYRLRIGSMVAKSDWSNIRGDSQMRIPYVAIPSKVYQLIPRDEAHYLTTQALDKINWSIRLLDSTGAPVEGASAEFHYWMYPDRVGVIRGITNFDGIARGEVSLGRRECSWNFTSSPYYHYGVGGGKSWWQSRFNFGLWYLKVIDAKDGAGVGSRTGRRVSLGHICEHEFIRLER